MLNETSYHGKGAILNVVPEILARGFKRILVCTDESLVRFGVSKKVTDLLDEGKINYEMFTEIKPNPTIENVLAGVKKAEEFFGVVVTPEKEIVMILVPEEIRDKVMSAVNAGAGMNTKGMGIAFALPVSDIVGIDTGEATPKETKEGEDKPA